MTTNYNILNDLVNVALEELKKYVETYEGGKFSTSTKGTFNVLTKLKEVVKEEQLVGVYLMQAIKSISTSAVKEYDDTDLGTAILEIKRFMMKEFPAFGALEPLRSDFSKYF